MSNRQDIIANTVTVNGTITNPAMTNVATLAFYPDCDQYYDEDYISNVDEFAFWSDCRTGRIGQLGWYGSDSLDNSVFQLQHFKSDTGLISADPASGIVTVNEGGAGTYLITATMMCRGIDDCYDPVVPQALLIRNPFPYVTTVTTAITDITAFAGSGTINVASVDGYPTGSYRRHIYVQTADGYARVNYTDTTTDPSPAFTGCSFDYFDTDGSDGAVSVGAQIIPYNILEDWDTTLGTNGRNQDGYSHVSGNNDWESKENTICTTASLIAGDTICLAVSYPYIDCSPVWSTKLYSVSLTVVRLA